MEKKYLENRRSQRTILIVDDEPVILDVLIEVLSSLGFYTYGANCRSEALEIFRSGKRRIDLVILDLRMKENNGLEIFSEIKKIDNDIKIIVCSGFIEHEMLAKFPKENLKGFIQKPFNIKKISDIIHNTI